MTSSSTLADLATTHPAAARVFYRHGLDFCCGGRRPLADVCAERGLDPSALVAAIVRRRTASRATAALGREPLPALIAFIVDTYPPRLREAFPELIRHGARRWRRDMARRRAAREGSAAHLTVMHESVLEHLAKEEQRAVPADRERSGTRGRRAGARHGDEHEDHARDARRHCVASRTDFEPPAEACVTWRALYLGLQQLEEELMVHIHLENNVLFRRALIE